MGWESDAQRAARLEQTTEVFRHALGLCKDRRRELENALRDLSDAAAHAVCEPAAFARNAEFAHHKLARQVTASRRLLRRFPPDSHGPVPPADEGLADSILERHREAWHPQDAAWTGGKPGDGKDRAPLPRTVRYGDGNLCCGGDTPCPGPGLTRRAWVVFGGAMAAILAFVAWTERGE